MDVVPLSYKSRSGAQKIKRGKKDNDTHKKDSKQKQKTQAKINANVKKVSKVSKKWDYLMGSI